MDLLITPGASLTGTLAMPADKAICHRAALLGGVTAGVTELAPWSIAEDCQYTLRLLAALGVATSPTPQGVRIHGVGLRGLRAPAEPLECGESGTTMRLACGLLAGQPFVSKLTAAPSLCRRPMRRITEPLSRMGARIEGSAHAPSASGFQDVYPPLTIEGRRPLTRVDYVMPLASAQVKSALLIAGLYGEGATCVTEPAQTRDHTERLLSRLGVCVRCQGNTVTVEPPHGELKAPGVLSIPGDLSSAAFFLVAATIVPGSKLAIRDVGLNPTRRHLLHVLQRMGAAITWTLDRNEWEPRGTLVVEHRPLRGTAITSDEVPFLIDELPILMVAACAAEGDTSFEGLGELRMKETDRLQSMMTGLGQLGARVSLRGRTGLLMAHSRLHGGEVESFNDHRTAMSLAVAGLLAEGQTLLKHADCVAKSFGSFFELLASVTSSSTVRSTGEATS